MYQNGWRSYDPSTGRYITSDPIGIWGGLSTYVYAMGNPLVVFDSLGLAGECIFFPQGKPDLEATDNTHIDVTKEWAETICVPVPVGTISPGIGSAGSKNNFMIPQLNKIENRGQVLT